jgi:hypothetical protein
MTNKISLFLLTAIFCLATVSLHADEIDERVSTLENRLARLQRLSISGSIQAQYQYAEYQADGHNRTVGSGINANELAGEEGFSRFGLRRGRVRFDYNERLVSFMAQLDIRDGGFNVQDIYMDIKDPWGSSRSRLRVGLFQQPFGHESHFSSTRRESPERSRFVRTIDMRQVGIMLTLQAPSTSTIGFLKLDAGLFGGNGPRAQFDSKMDFITRLSAEQKFGDITVGGGISGWFGNVPQTHAETWEVKNNAWALSNTETNFADKYLKRQYYAVDFQFAANTVAGNTTLRAEYIWGTLPGNVLGAYAHSLTELPAPRIPNPADPTTPIERPHYLRNINGGYILLSQSLGGLPLSVVAKYDWYNRNKDLSKDDVTQANDLQMSNIGFGMFWDINSVTRLTAYYDVVEHEKSTNVSGWDTARKMDVFTLRIQYRF